MQTKSYGQFGQDLIALGFFHLYPALQNFFLDVGAFDGMGFSNSRLLFEDGWSGVCIEPVLKNYQKLENLYENTGVITVRAAASAYEGEMLLNVATIPWAEDWGSDVSSSSVDALERWPDYKWDKEVVAATTINRILENNNIAHVDFVSIDVEGCEMSVLRGFDIKKYEPSLLVIEYSNLEERQEIVHHMTLQGYSSWIDNGQDIFFITRAAFKNWKILLYGCYHQIRFSKPVRYATRLVRQFRK